MANTSGQVSASNIDRVVYTGNNTVPTLPPNDGEETVVLLNGDRYDWNGTAWLFSYGFANTIPIPDNELDTAIRTGLIGTSNRVARADHNHPIRRQVIPTAPTITVSGTGFVLVSQILNWSTSDEESVYFGISINVTQTISNSWNFFTVPNIAGFQRAQVIPTASYRYSGNPLNDTTAPIDQQMPNAQTMNMEWSSYFNGTCYMNVPNRTQATAYWISFIVKYIRS